MESVVKKEISRISIIGTGIVRNINFMKKILDVIEKNKLDILELQITESKISIDFKNIITDDIVQEINGMI